MSSGGVGLSSNFFGTKGFTGGKLMDEDMGGSCGFAAKDQSSSTSEGIELDQNCVPKMGSTVGAPGVNEDNSKQASLFVLRVGLS